MSPTNPADLWKNRSVGLSGRSRGSNQYTVRTGPGSTPAADVSAIRDAVLAEQAAWVFSGVTDEDLPKARRVRRPVALQRFAGHPDHLVRVVVAEKPTCPPALLAVLATDGDARVRAAALQHPDCPPEALTNVVREMVDTRTFAVSELRAIIRNPACPTEALRLLQIDVAETPTAITAAVVKHPNCPPEIVDRVLHDDQAALPGLIRKRFAESVHPTETWLCAALRDVRIAAAAARNPNCPIDAAVAAVAGHPDPKTMLSALAHRVDCPPECLRQLVDRSDDLDDRVMVANHPNVAAGTLERLFYDDWRNPVLVAVVKHPNCPDRILTRAARDAGQPGHIAATRLRDRADDL